VSQKNVPLLVGYNTRERILIFFSRNVTDKVTIQKTLYFATFSLKCCISASPEFNLDFFSHFDSRLIITLLYDSLESCNQCVQLGAVGGHGSGERNSREPQQLDCVAHTKHVHQCAVFLKEKNVICDVFDSI